MPLKVSISIKQAVRAAAAGTDLFDMQELFLGERHGAVRHRHVIVQLTVVRHVRPHRERHRLRLRNASKHARHARYSDKTYMYMYERTLYIYISTLHSMLYSYQGVGVGSGLSCCRRRSGSELLWAYMYM